MMLISRLVMLVMIIVMLVFAISNLDPVTVRMVGWESPPLPLFLILLFVFFFGFFLALFWQAVRTVATRREHRKQPIVVNQPAMSKTKKKRRLWGGKSSELKKDAGKEESPVSEPAAMENNQSASKAEESHAKGESPSDANGR